MPRGTGVPWIQRLERVDRHRGTPLQTRRSGDLPDPPNPAATCKGARIAHPTYPRVMHGCPYLAMSRWGLVCLWLVDPARSLHHRGQKRSSIGRSSTKSNAALGWSGPLALWRFLTPLKDSRPQGGTEPLSPDKWTKILQFLRSRTELYVGQEEECRRFIEAVPRS